MSQTLLFCAPAPVIDGGGQLRLDIKFVEGMREHVTGWGGPVHVVLWRDGGEIPFGRDYERAALGFELTVLNPGEVVPESAMRGADVAMISADMPGFLGLVERARAAGLPVVAGLEYTRETRLRIVWLDKGTGLLRKLRRSLWVWQDDRRIRRGLAQATGVQFNGYPAFDDHAAEVRAPLLYLDHRMTPALLATPAEMQARAERLRSGAPLRLIHSGRLEPMKGAQDLLPVMAALHAMGVLATLDIYGSGSLEAPIRAGLAAFDGQVRLHGPVDFETVLVPASRNGADVFLSCHRQSDPSCTYLEALGCGLALAGYDNRMWHRLSGEVGLAAPAPQGDTGALAGLIAGWHRDREGLIAAAQTGLSFARAHDFPAEFAARMAHLRACAGR